MNHHLKTTFITTAFVCLTYGHSFATPTCDSMKNSNNATVCTIVKNCPTKGGGECDSPLRGEEYPLTCQCYAGSEPMGDCTVDESDC